MCPKTPLQRPGVQIPGATFVRTLASKMCNCRPKSPPEAQKCATVVKKWVLRLKSVKLSPKNDSKDPFASPSYPNSGDRIFSDARSKMRNCRQKMLPKIPKRSPASPDRARRPRFRTPAPFSDPRPVFGPPLSDAQKCETVDKNRFRRLKSVQLSSKIISGGSKM